MLDQVNRDSIIFLSALREKNAAAADQGFASLLARAERDPASDANTISGLSSYAFTPFLYVTFDTDGGGNQNRQRPPVPDPISLRPCARLSFALPRKSCCGHSRRQIRIAHRRAGLVSTW